MTTTTLHITAIEACDDQGDLLFAVKMFDSGAVEIDLKQTCHNASSWQELAAEVARAIKMMDLNVGQV